MTLPNPLRPPDWDLVDEASLESFPASDPPARGSMRAAPSASTVAPPEAEASTATASKAEARPASRRHGAWIALGALAGALVLGGLIAIGVKLRRAHT